MSNIYDKTNVCEYYRIRKLFTMIFATVKDRILHFIETKGINVSIFLRETGIKRGFLDGDKLKVAVSDHYFTKIIAAYPELNIEWLITGKGSMLKNIGDAPEEKGTTVTEINPDDPAQKMLLEMIDKKDLRIEELKEEIGKLKEQQAAFLEKNIYSDSASTIRIVAEEAVNKKNK